MEIKCIVGKWKNDYLQSETETRWAVLLEKGSKLYGFLDISIYNDGRVTRYSEGEPEFSSVKFGNLAKQLYLDYKNVALPENLEGFREIPLLPDQLIKEIKQSLGVNL